MRQPYVLTGYSVCDAIRVKPLVRRPRMCGVCDLLQRWLGAVNHAGLHLHARGSMRMVTVRYPRHGIGNG